MWKGPITSTKNGIFTIVLDLHTIIKTPPPHKKLGVRHEFNGSIQDTNSRHEFKTWIQDTNAGTWIQDTNSKKDFLTAKMLFWITRRKFGLRHKFKTHIQRHEFKTWIQDTNSRHEFKIKKLVRSFKKCIKKLNLWKLNRCLEFVSRNSSLEFVS